MSVFKRINVSDSFVVPYTTNKLWNLASSSFSGSQITFNIGKKYTNLFDPIGEYRINYQYDRLVYNTINTIYYPGFLPRLVNTSSKINFVGYK